MIHCVFSKCVRTIPQLFSVHIADPPLPNSPVISHFNLWGRPTCVQQDYQKLAVGQLPPRKVLEPEARRGILQQKTNSSPQWGAADAEIKVPSGENTELKRSPFPAWSRSVCSHTCYAHCQGVLPCLFLPFQSIHLHFFQHLSQFFPVLACRIN